MQEVVTKEARAGSTCADVQLVIMEAELASELAGSLLPTRNEKGAGPHDRQLRCK